MSFDPSRSHFKLSPELRSEFERHCKCSEAMLVTGREFEDLSGICKELIAKSLDTLDEGESWMEATSNSSISINIHGIAKNSRGDLLVCVSLKDLQQGKFFLTLLDNQEPIWLTASSDAVMCFEFERQAQEESTSYDMFPGILMSESASMAEIARFLSENFSGVYGRKLQTLLTFEIMPQSLKRVETGSDIPGVISVQFCDTARKPIFCELGLIQGGRLRGVNQILSFPVEGVELPRLGREALVSGFHSWFQPSEFHDLMRQDEATDLEMVEASGVAIKEMLEQVFFPEFDKAWELSLRGCVRSKTYPNTLMIFATVNDQDQNTLLPSYEGAATKDSLVSGFLFKVVQSSGNQEGEIEVDCEFKGYIVSEGLLHRSLVELSSNPSKSFLFPFISEVILGDLLERNVLEDLDFDSLPIERIRVVKLGNIKDYGAEYREREIYAIHATHRFGEHVLYLIRNMPAGMIRLAVANEDNSKVSFDLGTKYYVRTPAANEVRGRLPERPQTPESPLQE